MKLLLNFNRNVGFYTENFQCESRIRQILYHMQTLVKMNLYQDRFFIIKFQCVFVASILLGWENCSF